MSPIARCPACAMMFRVVAEQLEMAHGWVRCGQCGEVFDAGLHRLPDQAVHTGQGRSRQALRSLNDPRSPESSPALAPVGARERQDPVFDPNDAALAALPAHPPEMASAAVQESEAPPAVDFVRDASQRDFWNLPRVRAALGLVCLVLLAALLLQLAIGQKDVLAAQEPRLGPLLQAACRLLGCEVRPLRRIESLVIEQATFSKTGLDGYRLAFVFRNTGDAVVEVPALEVTLADSQDQAVVRRVIMPEQFAASAGTLAANAELDGALSLKVVSAGNQPASAAVQAGLVPVASYRIVAFYP